jgi:hypothetical protein
MTTLLVGVAAWVLMIDWTCRRLEKVSGALREPS